MAKCPHCEKVLMSTNFQAIETKEKFKMNNGFRAVAHCCPMCDSVLSVEIDPIAVKSDILGGLKKLLGR